MIEIPVHNQDGKQVSTLKVDEQLLGGEVRHALLKQAYVAMHANRRLGTSVTKNRSMVEGSTRKLYKQKGTGNARRGAVRTNIMKGGGVAFGKRNRDWRQDLPTKMRRLANRNAVLAKAVDQEIKIVDQFSFKKPSTQQFAKLLKALKIDRSCLLALAHDHDPVALSARNLEDIRITRVQRLNVYDLLSHRFLLVDKSTLQTWLDTAARQARPAAPANQEAA